MGETAYKLLSQAPDFGIERLAARVAAHDFDAAPLVVLVLGPAGSGRTTLRRAVEHLVAGDVTNVRRVEVGRAGVPNGQALRGGTNVFWCDDVDDVHHAVQQGLTLASATPGRNVVVACGSFATRVAWDKNVLLLLTGTGRGGQWAGWFHRLLQDERLVPDGRQTLVVNVLASATRIAFGALSGGDHPARAHPSRVVVMLQAGHAPTFLGVDKACAHEDVGYPACTPCFNAVEDAVERGRLKDAWGREEPPRSRFVFAVSDVAYQGYVLPVRVLDDPGHFLAEEVKNADPPQTSLRGCPRAPGVYVGTLVWRFDGEYSEWHGRTFHYAVPSHFEDVQPVEVPA